MTDLHERSPSPAPTPVAELWAAVGRISRRSGTVCAALPYSGMTVQPKTVLVAEDELLIRMMAVDVLTGAGFDVVEAGHAEDALIALQDRHGAIHLLFTDIHMPGTMNGLELAHHVRRVWPHVALLIASGQKRPLAAELPAGSVFLTKPYDPDHVVAHAQALTA
jgi:two-component system, response regulator PdtaR